jgi:hypothetical protein
MAASQTNQGAVDGLEFAVHEHVVELPCYIKANKRTPFGCAIYISSLYIKVARVMSLPKWLFQ